MLSAAPKQFSVMGVVNVTPDSFSDGGEFLNPTTAIAHGTALFNEGADIVDVGGESTRPGAPAISADEEMERVLPVIKGLAANGRVSIDTSKPEVARAAVEAGATLINDVTSSLQVIAAELGVGWVAMHMQGDPRTMQENPHYENVVDDVLAYLLERAELAHQAGVKEIWIDPGIGFGKTIDHNLSLLHHIDAFVASPFPVVVGASRKTFLGRITSDEDAPTPVDQRFEASIAAAVVAISQGVQMVRVHDVQATVRAAKIARAIREAA